MVKKSAVVLHLTVIDYCIFLVSKALYLKGDVMGKFSCKIKRKWIISDGRVQKWAENDRMTIITRKNDH